MPTNSIQKKAIIVSILLTVFLTKSFSQVTPRVCATQTSIEYKMQHDAAYKADYENKSRGLQSYISSHPHTRTLSSNTPIIIPVVVHIVLPNPNIVTDENVDYFINRLNTDYSGFNDDSTNGSSFYGVRGHSLLRFALARRDINGNATTGIERKVGTGSIGLNDPQPIKTDAAGLAPWDITQYYNLWVGVGASGLLGIAPEIGPGTQSGTSIDGICCDYKVFANNPCFSVSGFALARTSVHEIGHNMGLNHIFQGATTSGCTSTDFSDDLTSPGMFLPANLLGPADDTPPQDVETSGCPTQGAGNGCTPSVPKMFQNYMDYTNDDCYSMFTKGQVARMHYVLEYFRPGYLTTKGHLPPDGTKQNEVAATDIVSPGGSEVIGCNSYSYNTPTCGSGVFTPKLKVTNFGVQPLNSITISLDMNGTVVATQTFATNLAGGKSAVFSLPNQTLVNGINTLKYYTSNPNGFIDSVNTNDTLTLIANFSNIPPAPATLPLIEGFENAAFDPTINGWTVANATTGTNTWARTTAAFKTGTACSTIKLFGNTATGDLDYLKSPLINFNNTADTAYISFNYAYRLKSNNNSAKRDTFSVEIATDCEAKNWVSIWKKAGDNLKTNSTTATTNWTAAAADWTTTPVKISLQAYKNLPIYIALKTRNGNGQNIYVDDIKIYTVPNPLPLNLLSFTAQQNTKNIICKWETNKEVGVKSFEIEKSIDGIIYENIGNVNASGIITGNANYQFIDEKALTQNNKELYYRLKINDVNGKFNYSNIVRIKIGEKQILQLYPNPAKDVMTVSINNTSTANIVNTIQIIDYLGRILLEQKILSGTGTKNTALNIALLPKGSFVLMLKNDVETKSIKFIKE